MHVKSRSYIKIAFVQYQIARAELELIKFVKLLISVRVTIYRYKSVSTTDAD